MARSSRSRKPARKNYEALVVKPSGVIGPRVQAVGAEHFGIVAIDPAKHRSKFIFCDFFGQLLIEPTWLDHNQPAFDAGIGQVRAAAQRHQILDLTVAIERTGTYHRPVQHAFTKAKLETRLVHPFASKQYRQPADPGNKTDDTDTAAVFRATVNGFGLLEPTWPDLYLQLQWLCRQRRDLVRKTSKLRCQIQEQVHALMPGYVPLFAKHFFDSAIALLVAQHTGSAQAILSLDIQGLRDLIRKQPPPRPVCRTSTLARLVDWARNAPKAPATPNAQVPYVRACLNSLVDDFRGKSREIAHLEQQLAHLLARTPYVLLLALPGINVASAAGITGRAGPKRRLVTVTAKTPFGDGDRQNAFGRCATKRAHSGRLPSILIVSWHSTFTSSVATPRAALKDKQPIAQHRTLFSFVLSIHTGHAASAALTRSCSCGEIDRDMARSRAGSLPCLSAGGRDGAVRRKLAVPFGHQEATGWRTR